MGMTLYVTNTDFNKVKNSFLNFRSFSVIDVQYILKTFQYDKDTLNEYIKFIIDEEIINIIKDSILKKKYTNVMYINKNINDDIIENLKEYIKQEPLIEKLIFIDNTEQTHIKLYPLFDEVIFFPKTKRIHIIQCESIKNPLYYWLNNQNSK